MPIEIYAVGGYDEVGKNCTLIKVDNEAIILDMGLHLPNYIRLTEEEGESVIKLSAKQLMSAGAIPDVSFIKPFRKYIYTL